VSLGVLDGVGEGAQVPSQKPAPILGWTQNSRPAGQLSAAPPEQSTASGQHARIVPPNDCSQMIWQKSQVPSPKVGHGTTLGTVTPSHTQQIASARGAEARLASTATAVM